MNGSVALLSHPYHRGGVTKWMADAFNAFNKISIAYFICVKPAVDFISGQGRPLVTTLLAETYSQNVISIPVGRAYELGTSSYRARTLRNLILKYLPAGVPIIPSDDEACWMAAAACSSRNPMVAILHADEEWYLSLAKKYSRHISVFCCVSYRILSKLNRRFPELSFQSTWIPCGVIVNDFFSSVREDLIVWIGRLSKYQKRPQDIIPIFKKVHQKFPAAHLIIFGHGDYSDQITEEIDRADLRKYVSQMGWSQLPAIRKALSRAKVFIQTSDFEGTSVAMMEALSSGCLVVSTRVSGAEDLEKREEAKNVVKLFNVGDVEAGSDLTVQALISHNIELSTQARNLAYSCYDCETNLSKLITFLDLIVQQGRVQNSFQISVLEATISPVIAFLRYWKNKIWSS